MSSTLSTPEHYASLIDKYDTFMFDCDGVLWNGNQLVDGVVEVLKFLRSKGTLSTILSIDLTHR
jgi:4-nitrophenyl phosphatase